MKVFFSVSEFALDTSKIEENLSSIKPTGRQTESCTASTDGPADETIGDEPTTCTRLEGFNFSTHVLVYEYSITSHVGTRTAVITEVDSLPFLFFFSPG